MSLFKISLWRGFCVGLFLLLIPVSSSYAGSWADVLASLSACEALSTNSSCYIEEVLTPARVYRIWERDSAADYQKRHYANSTSQNCVTGSINSCTGGGTTNVTCDGVNYNSYRFYTAAEATTISCMGILTTGA